MFLDAFELFQKYVPSLRHKTVLPHNSKRTKFHKKDENVCAAQETNENSFINKMMKFDARKMLCTFVFDVLSFRKLLSNKCKLKLKLCANDLIRICEK